MESYARCPICFRSLIAVATFTPLIHLRKSVVHILASSSMRTSVVQLDDDIADRIVSSNYLLNCWNQFFPQDLLERVHSHAHRLIAGGVSCSVVASSLLKDRSDDRHEEDSTVESVVLCSAWSSNSHQEHDVGDLGFAVAVAVLQLLGTLSGRVQMGWAIVVEVEVLLVDIHPESVAPSSSECGVLVSFRKITAVILIDEIARRTKWKRNVPDESHYSVE